MNNKQNFCRAIIASVFNQAKSRFGLGINPKFDDKTEKEILDIYRKFHDWGRVINPKILRSNLVLSNKLLIAFYIGNSSGSHWIYLDPSTLELVSK